MDRGKVVSIRYTVTLDERQPAGDPGRGEALEYLHGTQSLPPGLERVLVGKVTGDRLAVTLGPEDAFGLRRSEAVQTVPRDVFPASAKLAPGQMFRGTDQNEDPVVGTVVSVEGDGVTIDFNHPLAGKDVRFDVEVAAVRDATPQERELGRALESVDDNG